MPRKDTINRLIQPMSTRPRRGVDASIIYFNIIVGPIEEFLILDFVFYPNNAPESFLDFLFSSRCVLPAVKANDFYNAVDIVDDSLHDDGRALMLNTVE